LATNQDSKAEQAQGRPALPHEVLLGGPGDDRRRRAAPEWKRSSELLLQAEPRKQFDSLLLLEVCGYIMGIISFFRYSFIHVLIEGLENQYIIDELNIRMAYSRYIPSVVCERISPTSLYWVTLEM